MIKIKNFHFGLERMTLVANKTQSKGEFVSWKMGQKTIYRMSIERKRMGNIQDSKRYRLFIEEK